MDFLDSKHNIIACSTDNKSNVAIALIRISGSLILEQINEFLSIDISKIKPRYAHFCKIIDREHILDEIILTYFQAPNSYNGEDIVELNVHGNILNVDRIINLIVSKTSIIKAQPGEFTYRALRNNKLSLSQVEGLDLFLNAGSVFALDQGFSLLSGDLQKAYSALRDRFLEHRAALELGFDFLDDVGEEAFDLKFRSSLNELLSAANTLNSHVENSGANLIKPEIVLVGQPNAGKSSLFNSLLGSQRSIVSNIAGTTRDYISSDIKVNQNIFSLIDTAGIRTSKDVVEEEGISRAIELASSAFFKVLVINPFDFSKNYLKQLSLIKFDLIIFTHKDLDSFNVKVQDCVSELFSIFGPIEPSKTGPIEPNKTGPIEPIKTGPIEPIPFISLNLTKSFEKTDVLFSAINKYSLISLSNPLILDRHRDSISNIYNLLVEYNQLTCSESDISIIGSELNIVGHCISELIGIVSPKDVLSHIFTNFCIGK